MTVPGPEKVFDTLSKSVTALSESVLCEAVVMVNPI